MLKKFDIFLNLQLHKVVFGVNIWYGLYESMVQYTWVNGIACFALCLPWVPYLKWGEVLKGFLYDNYFEKKEQ